MEYVWHYSGRGDGILVSLDLLMIGRFLGLFAWKESVLGCGRFFALVNDKE